MISKIIAGALAMLAPYQAFAADASESDEGVRADTGAIIVLGTRAEAEDVPIATGSRLGLTALETPASVETIDGDELRRRGDLTIVDAVTRATGISSVANPGNGGTGLSARGFSGQGSVMILYDGVRLYPGAGTVTFPTDPWTVDRIEVLRGPASVLYGQGAIGGAINVISKRPNRERTEVAAEVGFGSQDSYRVAAGAGGPLGEMLAYRVDASKTGSDGWVDRGGSDGFAITGALEFRPSDALTLTFSHDFSDQEPMRYFGTPLIDGRIDDRNKRSNYNVRDAVIDYVDNRTTGRIEWAIAEGIVLTNSTYRLATERSWRNLESYCWVAANGFCPAGLNDSTQTAGSIFRTDFLGIDHDQTQIGNQGNLLISRPIGGMNNDLLIGFDVNFVKFRHSNNFALSASNSVDPFQFDPGLFDASVPVAPAYRTRTRQFSIFAENRLALSERFSLVAGINFEKANVRRWTIAPNGSETKVVDATLENTSFRLGGVYQPTPSLSLYGQFATGVDPLGSLITLSVSQANFKNATAEQIEAGIKYSFFDGRGLATLAVYRIEKKNLLVRDPANLTNPTPLQVGARSAKGIEASLDLELGAGFDIMANAAILDARFDEFNAGGVSFNGRTPPNVAEATANLWLTYDATDRLQMRGGLRYVGRRYSDNANAFRIPAYAVVDAGISYALTANVAANFRVQNLFDSDYATNAYNDQQWLLGRPRSVDISISAKF